ncbi:PREDICTED: uncharacterized protein LOC104600478 isoform X1 [Nelumbo nucifera]|uniref:Uncharacterized protein LOC104600478 isoform X1 n=1 Tax=Nelumbo nucifera TaxID=4432 RepID=A0A1U8A9A2_NELNU|nr:PREDICTED: uncharacterized protein LOC104600478 isoform X1 [Nelumbo nucifera]
MASGEEKSNDFYAVLGLKKECTATELKNAYKKLALKWHPDRCSSSGNSKFVEDSKKKFQAIQEAYSVLSDENKRFLYDVGVYDCDDDDDDENGMGEFLGEMATMMSQIKPSENGPESLEKLQELFEEMFQRDMDDGFFSPSPQCASFSSSCSSSSSSTTYFSYNNNKHDNKRNCSDISSMDDFYTFGTDSIQFSNFCIGVEGGEDSKVRGGKSRRKSNRRQKVSSSKHDPSCR